MASETEIECAILAADGTYNAMGLHAQELGRIIRELKAERDELRDKLADAPPQEPEPEKPGYQEFYDSIGARNLLFRKSATPKPESARRGRVVKPEELREGDVYDICTERHSTIKNMVASHGSYTASNFYSDDEIRLISRKPPEPASNPCTLRTFHLVRDEDETGVSGTGKVAEGVICSDGHVSLRWVVGEHRPTVAYDSVEAVEAIHGHGGKTRVVPAGQEGE